MTFADLITPQGMLVASGMIVTLVSIMKAALPALDARVSGATLAFVLSGLLYGIANFVLPGPSPDLFLSVFAAWIVVAAGAMGLKAGGDHITAVRDGTAGLTSVVDPTPHTEEDQSAAIALEVPIDPEIPDVLPTEEPAPAG